MKTRIVCSAFLAVAVMLVLSSYVNGPANHAGWDCSGAESGLSNPTGCTTGSGCHASAATAGITVAIELDSAGTAVTSYTGGQTYTVKLTGINTLSSLQPAFGFQMTAIKGSTEQVTPTNAGTWGTAPANTHISAPRANDYVLNVFEHSEALAPATGTGGAGTTYVETINWTAPVAGTGTVSFWAALNAVNDNGNADAGDLWNVTHLVITEDTAAIDTTTGITSIPTGAINIYPNPVSDRLNLQWDNAATGNFTLSVYNLTGQLITTQKGAAGTQCINTTTWAPGIYLLNIETGNGVKVVRVVKE